MNWYLEVLRKYAVFHGRARRKEYWYYQLFSIIIIVVLMVIDFRLGSYSGRNGIGVFQGTYSLAVFIPSLAVCVRRLHDVDRSGWWLLINLIPILGPLFFLGFLVLDSNPGENKYGPNPKGVPAATGDNKQPENQQIKLSGSNLKSQSNGKGQISEQNINGAYACDQCGMIINQEEIKGNLFCPECGDIIGET